MVGSALAEQRRRWRGRRYFGYSAAFLTLGPPTCGGIVFALFMPETADRKTTNDGSKSEKAVAHIAIRPGHSVRQPLPRFARAARMRRGAVARTQAAIVAIASMEPS